MKMHYSLLFQSRLVSTFVLISLACVLFWRIFRQVGRLAARLLLFSGGPNAAEWTDGLGSDSFKAAHA